MNTLKISGHWRFSGDFGRRGVGPRRGYWSDQFASAKEVKFSFWEHSAYAKKKSVEVTSDEQEARNNTDRGDSGLCRCVPVIRVTSSLVNRAILVPFVCWLSTEALLVSFCFRWQFTFSLGSGQFNSIQFYKSLLSQIGKFVEVITHKHTQHRLLHN